MGYPIALALRYLGSKKRAFISIGTVFAILGVTLGGAALALEAAAFEARLRQRAATLNQRATLLSGAYFKAAAN